MSGASRPRSEGDGLTIDLGSSTIAHGEKTYTFPKLPESIRHLLEAGGLMAYLKSRFSEPAG